MIKFTFSRKRVAEVVANEVVVAQAATPVLHRVGHAIRHAPIQHRIISFLVFAAIWIVFEYFLHYEYAAKAAEFLGLAPATDRIWKLIVGEAEE